MNLFHSHYAYCAPTFLSFLVLRDLSSFTDSTRWSLSWDKAAVQASRSVSAEVTGGRETWYFPALRLDLNRFCQQSLLSHTVLFLAFYQKQTCFLGLVPITTTTPTLCFVCLFVCLVDSFSGTSLEYTQTRELGVGFGGSWSLYCQYCLLFM